LTSTASTIVELIARHALRTPDAVAILAPGRPPLTFRALTRQIDAAILTLAAAGFGRGDRVALTLPNGPEMAVALLAVTGGATCVPLNPALDEASCRVVLQALRVDALIVPRGEHTPAVRAAHSLTLPIIRLAFSPIDPAGTFTLVADSSRPAVTPEPPAPEDVALVLHTAGSTAKPKAVPLTHRLLVEPSLMRARHLQLTSADRCLCVRPLFTAGGMRRCLFPPLVVGGSVVCTPGLDGNSFIEWLDEFAPSFYSGAPAVQRAVLEELECRGGAPRPTLRFILSASAALPASLAIRLEAALGVPVLQGYGTTETGVIAQNPRPPRLRRVGSVGLPVSNEFAVLGGAGAFLPPGEMGEIVVRGPEVFSGYEDNAEANRDAFFEGWFRTGDLGYVDRDGYLFIVGRANELINRGGFKVSPSAVDAAMIRHPEVVDAATFAVPHATLGEDVVTAVVVRKQAQVTAQALRDFALEQLSVFMVPSQMMLLPDLGRTPAGKLNRAELAITLRQHLRAEFSAPRGAQEALVAGVFSEVLGVDGVGAFDNFFELGGDSLRGAQVVVRVNSALGSNLGVVDLFKRPTVAEFATELTAAATGRQSGPPPLRPRQRTACSPDAKTPD